MKKNNTMFSIIGAIWNLIATCKEIANTYPKSEGNTPTNKCQGI